MANLFTTEAHYMFKAVAKAGIFFPISKADCIAKAGDLKVKVDWDKYLTLKEILESMKPDFYDNASHFYNAYLCVRTEEAAREKGLSWKDKE